MKHKVSDNFEEDESGIESRERNKALIQEFDIIYRLNCQRSGRSLTCVENTKIFMSGNITRLLLPPRTHHSDCLRRVSENIYVQIKK